MTDTNQASEDIRNHISRNICHEAYGSEYEELTSIAKWTHDTLVDEIIMPAIKALIRTEKLKLLAEVRERVVDKPTGNHNADSLLERDVLIYNQATAYLRTKLTKLEAELL